MIVKCGLLSQDYQNSTQILYHLWSMFMGHWAYSSNISPFTIHRDPSLINADAMGNTYAIRFIFLGAVCFHLDAYHCKVESNQSRRARHEIRVCERRLAIQCNKQNRSSLGSPSPFFSVKFFCKNFCWLDSMVFFRWRKTKSNTTKRCFLVCGCEQ